MLYHWLLNHTDYLSVLNVFRYITFRSGMAVLTALILSFCFGGKLIAWLRQHQHGGQPIREDGPESHLKNKKGTPTMGGLLILFSTGIATLLWGDLSNAYLWIVLMVTFIFGILGFIDDFLKVTKRNSKGISGKIKLVVQVITSILACIWIQSIADPAFTTHLSIPFTKHLLLDISWFYIPFAVVVMVGASNAVNLTDGLDGLAIVPVVIAAGCFALISYLVGHIEFARYLHIPYVAHTGELAIVCAALVGAGLGFLWYNAPPAKVFMGDTGSLALGGSIGTISVVTKHELVLAIVGGLFVMEAASVILQVYYFKFTGGKRIFKMAPLHHHFEKLGWHETTVVIRFWIIAIIFALIGLSTLKLR